MNQYLKNLDKIEFVITDACTGRCKHCSQGEHKLSGVHISAHASVEIVKRVCEYYPIKTVMTFGGEPLLFPETVCEIHKTAYSLNVPVRQLITNGFFTKDQKRIKDVAESLAESGVNDLLLSIDAFHQEFIPTDVVKTFALEAMNAGIPVRIQPAWLVSRGDDNPYNVVTNQLLDEFSTLGIRVGDGNVIFPEGSALKYLSEYLDNCVENPYVENPRDVKCLSVGANGDVLDSNIYDNDIISIIKDYSV